MNEKMADGLIIVLSWPDTYVYGTGSQYDKIFKLLGFVKNGKYKAGHAALVLIDKSNGSCEFYDFGRYITPDGKGRVRGPLTDPEVILPIKANFDTDNSLINLEEILLWLDRNGQATHGDGRLIASCCSAINYRKSKEFILGLQQLGSIRYSPFHPVASNCSRFVADAIKAGVSNRWIRLKNTIRTTGTPSPLGNVLNGTTDKKLLQIHNGRIKSFPAKRSVVLRDVLSGFIERTPQHSEKSIAHLGTILEPQRSANLNCTATWLGGTGAGAWFQLISDNASEKKQLVIQRIASNGKVDFTNIYNSNTPGFDSRKAFRFVYDSNALYCTILQNGKRYRLEFISIYQKREVKHAEIS